MGGVEPMRESCEGSVARAWRGLLGQGSATGLEDGPLLERFAGRSGDAAAEAAFAALVARHGPMVRRVCRKLLADPHDADDAFQATFLVLARKARSIRRPERLAGWLYGTAHRSSRKLRADRARRRKHEAARLAPTPGADPDHSEEAAIVLDEVARLPRDCRVAVVLCDLEGLTQEEAADRLGCSARTVRRRLARGHDLLRDRLTRRGIAPPMALLAIGSDPVPLALVDATARAALRFAIGGATAGVVPASTPALGLAAGVLATMNWTRWKLIAALAGSALALGGGLGVASGWMPRPQATPDSPRPKADGPAVAARPDAAERYKALVKRWDEALRAYQEAGSKATTDAEREAVFLKFGPFARDHSPGFVALAEEFPADPVALDALLWVARQGLSSVYNADDPGGRAFARALEILARDHADDPRVAVYAEGLAYLLLDPIREDFLRAVAGRASGRAARGRTTLALAGYLGQKAALVGMIQKPDLPADLDALTPPNTPEGERRKMEADPAAYRRQVESFYSKNLPSAYALMKGADLAGPRAEVDRANARVLADFADVPAESDQGQPTRETLGDLVRRHRGPRAAGAAPVESRVQPLADAYRAARRKADEAGDTAGPGALDLKAYIAAAPRWSDWRPRRPSTRSRPGTATCLTSPARRRPACPSPRPSTAIWPTSAPSLSAGSPPRSPAATSKGCRWPSPTSGARSSCWTSAPTSIAAAASSSIPASASWSRRTRRGRSPSWGSTAATALMS